MTKILYVEDNDDNIYMITRRLGRHGYEVVVRSRHGPKESVISQEEKFGIFGLRIARLKT